MDAKDHERFPEAKAELDALLSFKELSNVPFLVLGNKIDAMGAVSEDELRSNLSLYQTIGKVHCVVSAHGTLTNARISGGKGPSQRHPPN